MNKIQYCLTSLLICLNLLLRYPLTQHEMGVDTFLYHTHANSITEYGAIKWFIHPLSFFGMYPLSEEAGISVLISGVSQVTSIETEYTILLLSMFMGITGTFGCFIFAHRVRSYFFFAYVVAFIFGLSRIYIGYTDWLAGTRSLFMTLLPFMMWACLQYFNRSYYIILVMIFLFSLASSHNLVFFLPVLILPLIVTQISLYFNRNYRIS